MQLINTSILNLYKILSNNNIIKKELHHALSQNQEFKNKKLNTIQIKLKILKQIHQN